MTIMRLSQDEIELCRVVGVVPELYARHKASLAAAGRLPSLSAAHAYSIAASGDGIPITLGPPIAQPVEGPLSIAELQACAKCGLDPRTYLQLKNAHAARVPHQE